MWQAAQRIMNAVQCKVHTVPASAPPYMDLWQAAQRIMNAVQCKVHTAPASAPPYMHLYTSYYTHCIERIISHFANLSLHTANIQNLPELDLGFTWKTVP